MASKGVARKIAAPSARKRGAGGGSGGASGGGSAAAAQGVVRVSRASKDLTVAVDVGQLSIKCRKAFSGGDEEAAAWFATSTEAVPAFRDFLLDGSELPRNKQQQQQQQAKPVSSSSRLRCFVCIRHNRWTGLRYAVLMARLSNGQLRALSFSERRPSSRSQQHRDAAGSAEDLIRRAVSFARSVAFRAWREQESIKPLAQNERQLERALKHPSAFSGADKVDCICGKNRSRGQMVPCEVCGAREHLECLEYKQMPADHICSACLRAQKEEVVVINVDEQEETRQFTTTAGGSMAASDSKARRERGDESICCLCGCEDNEDFDTMIQPCKCEGDPVLAHRSCLALAMECSAPKDRNKQGLTCQACGRQGGSPGSERPVTLKRTSRRSANVENASATTNTARGFKRLRSALTHPPGKADSASSVPAEPELKKAEVEPSALGRRFGEDASTVPIKKRRIHLMDSAPPPTSSPSSSPVARDNDSGYRLHNKENGGCQQRAAGEVYEERLPRCTENKVEEDADDDYDLRFTFGSFKRPKVALCEQDTSLIDEAGGDDSQRDRSHWDLNRYMDAWERPCEAFSSGQDSPQNDNDDEEREEREETSRKQGPAEESPSKGSPSKESPSKDMDTESEPMVAKHEESEATKAEVEEQERTNESESLKVESALTVEEDEPMKVEENECPKLDEDEHMKYVMCIGAEQPEVDVKSRVDVADDKGVEAQASMPDTVTKRPMECDDKQVTEEAPTSEPAESVRHEAGGSDNVEEVTVVNEEMTCLEHEAAEIVKEDAAFPLKTDHPDFKDETFKDDTFEEEDEPDPDPSSKAAKVEEAEKVEEGQIRDWPEDAGEDVDYGDSDEDVETKSSPADADGAEQGEIHEPGPEEAFNADQHPESSGRVDASRNSRSKGRYSGWDQLPEGFDSAEEALRASRDYFRRRPTGWSGGRGAPPPLRPMPGSGRPSGFDSRFRLEDPSWGRHDRNDVYEADSRFFPRDFGRGRRASPIVGRRGDMWMNGPPPGQWTGPKHHPSSSRFTDAVGFGPANAAAVAAAKVESSGFMVAPDGTITKAGSPSTAVRAGGPGRPFPPPGRNPPGLMLNPGRSEAILSDTMAPPPARGMPLRVNVGGMGIPGGLGRGMHHPNYDSASPPVGRIRSGWDRRDNDLSSPFGYRRRSPGRSGSRSRTPSPLPRKFNRSVSPGGRSSLPPPPKLPLPPPPPRGQRSPPAGLKRLSENNRRMQQQHFEEREQQQQQQQHTRTSGWDLGPGDAADVSRRGSSRFDERPAAESRRKDKGLVPSSVGSSFRSTSSSRAEGDDDVAPRRRRPPS